MLTETRTRSAGPDTATTLDTLPKVQASGMLRGQLGQEKAPSTQVVVPIADEGANAPDASPEVLASATPATPTAIKIPRTARLER
jgi:hypothetical protein